MSYTSVMPPGYRDYGSLHARQPRQGRLLALVTNLFRQTCKGGLFLIDFRTLVPGNLKSETYS